MVRVYRFAGPHEPPVRRDDRETWRVRDLRAWGRTVTAGTLRVAEVPEQAHEGVTVEDAAIDWLLGEFNIAPKVVDTRIVQSEKPGEATRAYVVQAHEVPGPGGELRRMWACSCPDYAYNRIPEAVPDPDAVESVPAALADIEPCKHAEAVRRADRSTAARDDDQGALGEFAPGSEQ